jgi:hypothetical protein
MTITTEQRLKLLEKFSKTQCNNVLTNNYKNHKSGFFLSKKMNRSFYYRSS